MRQLVYLIAILSFSVVIQGQAPPSAFDLSNYGVRIEPDKRVVAVLSTLEMATQRNAAGIDEKLLNTPLSEKGAAFREQLLKENATIDPKLRERISMFVAQHKRRNPKLSDVDLVAPFISMAYTLTAVPDLSDPVITNDLPGPLLDVLDFAPLVREFYRRSSLASKLDDYVKEYRAEADTTLRASAREMVSDLLGYVRTRPRLTATERITTQTQKGKATTLQKVETREHERRFFIVPERLAARGTVNFVNIRDDYYVVVPPDTDLGFSEVRRAFLQFVLDPLVLNNSKELTAVRAWVKTELDEKRKTDPTVTPDVFLAVTRSLVAAADVRQSEYARLRIATERAREQIAKLETDKEKLALSDELKRYQQTLADEALLRLYEDHKKGAVLSFYFADQLKGIEDSGFDIAASLREMIASFDPAKESERVASTADARVRAEAAREARKGKPDTSLLTAESPVTKKLIEIQGIINSKDYVRATSELKSLLAANPKEPRVFYNLGRVAGLEAVAIEDPEAQAKKLLEAKNAYSKVIENATVNTDRALLSLTFVALGRIYEHNNETAYALRLYDEAIKLDDVRGGGFNEALAAKQRLLKP